MDTIAERKQRWCRFYDESQPPTHLFTINVGYDPFIHKPIPLPQNRQFRIEHAWNVYCRQMEQIQWLADDTIPSLMCYSGTEVFACAFGCKAHYPQNDIPCALPMIHSAAEIGKVKIPDLSHPALQESFIIADELLRRAGKGPVFRVPDIQSPIDIVALIWDKNDLYMAMIETPEAVREVAEKVKTLLIAYFDEWFRRYGKELIGHYPGYYLPYGLSVSEDEIGAVNQDVFVDLFLPELIDLQKHFGQLGMHCCANSFHQWDNLKKIPGLKILNICQPAPIVQKAYDFFNGHTCQMHGGWTPDGDPWTWPGKFPVGSRVVMDLLAKNKDEAVRMCEKMREVLGR